MATTRANPSPRILSIPVTGSTNADVLAMARRGEPAGLVLVAGHQTAGRGRLDRRWEAPAGANLLMSILFRPAGSPERWGRCATAVAVAAAEACRDLGADQARPPSARSWHVTIEASGPSGPARNEPRAAKHHTRTEAPGPDRRALLGIKWPNDLVVGDDKLAGLLAETDGAGAVVVGLGVNVGWPAAGEYPGGVSLAALGVAATPAELLDRLLARLAERGPDAPDLLDRYRGLCATTGRDVHIELPDGTAVDGRAVGVDDDGLLLVECATAEPAGPAFVIRRFAVGDVLHARRT